jgi:hypothetical protein
MKTISKLSFFVIAVLLLVGMPQESNAQLLPTNLKITVLDGLGNVVEGAEVTIYKTKEDYLNNENALATASTDKKGEVKFKKLEPIVYFVDARTDEMNNDGGGAEIAPLDEGRINAVNIVIE